MRFKTYHFQVLAGSVQVSQILVVSRPWWGGPNFLNFLLNTLTKTAIFDIWLARFRFLRFWLFQDYDGGTPNVVRFQKMHVTKLDHIRALAGHVQVTCILAVWGLAREAQISSIFVKRVS